MLYVSKISKQVIQRVCAQFTLMKLIILVEVDTQVGTRTVNFPKTLPNFAISMITWLLRNNPTFSSYR